MSEKHLHIISFNIPFPADYGGVIDVFYKIKSLYNKGIKVHLHAFHYGRTKSDELEKICHTVHYYPRGTFFQAIYSSVPYIVGSRKSDDLLEVLNGDDYPVLFEGLHTCFYLNHPSLKDRLKIVRMHNIEWDYYNSLGKAEKNFFIKFYLYSESSKLKKYEEILKDANIILGISQNDSSYLEARFSNVYYLPAFHPNETVKSPEGRGDYCLYHGNLKVQENNQAAIFLIKKVFDELEVPFKIAGTLPSDMVKKEIKKGERYELIEGPYNEQMQQLIENAHINVLPTFQPTGIKLKLLNALFNGRWVVVNPDMVANTGLEELCVITETSDDMKSAIINLMQKDFTQAEIQKRKKVLSEKFSNETNANRLIRLVYGVPQKVAPAAL
jgi:hypothetical protein